MSRCPTFEHLSASVDGELPADRETEVRQHLETCGVCRWELDALTALKRAVGRGRDSAAPAPALRRVISAARPKRHRMP